MIRGYRILDSAESTRYIRPVANKYSDLYRQPGDATAYVSFRSPPTLTKQLEVMTYIERRSVSSVCFEGLALVVDDRRNNPFEMHPDVEGANGIAHDELVEAYRVTQALLPPDITS
jgi:hypothetical protein